MTDQRRRLLAVSILGISFLIVVYLLFFSPSERKIELATPTTTGATVASPTA